MQRLLLSRLFSRFLCAFDIFVYRALALRFGAIVAACYCHVVASASAAAAATAVAVVFAVVCRMPLVNFNNVSCEYELLII